MKPCNFLSVVFASAAGVSALSLFSGIAGACTETRDRYVTTITYSPSDMMKHTQYAHPVMANGAFYAQGSAPGPKCMVYGPYAHMGGPGEINGTIKFAHAPSVVHNPGRTDLDRAMRFSLTAYASVTLTQKELYIHEMHDFFRDTNEMSLNFHADSALDAIEVRLCDVDPEWTDIPIVETKLTITYSAEHPAVPKTCDDN